MTATATAAKVTPNQHVALRTLTEKSVLKFGKYHDYTVENMFKAGKAAYLIWAYFHCQNISFTKDILQRLKIAELQIPKPGKAPEFYLEHKAEFTTLGKSDDTNFSEEYVEQVIHRIKKKKLDSALHYTYVPKGQKASSENVIV